MTNLAQLRLDLATARAEQRTAKDALDTAKDALDTAKAIATLNITGKNDDERKKATAQALLDSQHYTLALIAFRDREFAVEQIEAQIAIEEDTIRLRELEARERLNEALRGKRADNAVADAVLDNVDWYEVQNEADHRRITAMEAAHRSECEQRMLASRHQEPVFPAGSNAGEYYPNDWYK